MKKQSISVSFHSASKQFVRYVGQSIGRDGTARPHCFYLGNDQTAALALAIQIRADWTALRASGATHWSQGYIDRFKAIGSVGVGNGEPSARVSNETRSVSFETVDDARNAFIGEIRQRYEARQVSASFLLGITNRLATALERLPFPILDKPTASIDETTLRKIVLHWAGRPSGRARCQSKRATNGKWTDYKRRSGTKRPKRNGVDKISACYAKHLIASLKMFFVWAYETERWNQPRRFNKLFRFKFEAKIVEPERFSVDELKRLYSACLNDRHRLWILLGLNCGFDRMGLATLDWSMVKSLDTDEPFIERLRNKTSVYCRYQLWSETAELLRAIPIQSRKGIVCLTEQGKPLIESNANGLRDSTHQAWRIISKRASVNKSFGKLRKTGAWITKQVSGLEVSEIYLAHTEIGMNKHYAGRNWDRLNEALAEMRRQLQPMFEA